MGAYPSIISATGYVGNGTDIWLMCLYENKAIEGHTQGMAKFQGSRHDIVAGMCYQDIPHARISCVNPTYYGLKSKATVLVNAGTIFPFACIESFGCITGDDCVNRTCGTWGDRISFVTDIPVVATNWSQPSSPAPITVTPGNTSLTIGWSKVSDPTGLPEVFAYFIAITDDLGNPVTSGYMEAGARSITIGGLTNGKSYTASVQALSHNDVISPAATATGTPVGATNPQIFSMCWGASITPPCGLSPSQPPITPGTSFSIMADIYNTGTTGKVRAVFKIDGVPIGTVENPNLQQCSGTACQTVQWYPTVNYTMPSKNVALTVETYGWTGTAWTSTPTDTRTLTISTSTPTCTTIGVNAAPYIIKAGDKVTLTATATPSTTPFNVSFKLRDGTVIGQCTTAGGTCQYLWDTTGKSPGDYYITASVPGQCTSAETYVQISPAIKQWNVNIYVKDSVTSNPVAGATVQTGVQTKITDSAGYVMFTVDEGTISISISKTGYATYTDPAVLVFSDITKTYPLVASGATTGSLIFVTVPTGVDIYIGTTLKGTTDIATGVLAVLDLPAEPVSYTAKKTGYNDSTGSVTVIGGQATTVPISLTPGTPTTGALEIFSTPPNADIFIDGISTGTKTHGIITNLTPGSHTYGLILTGYQDATGTVNIEAGKTAVITVTLQPLTTIGTLEISSTPAGARVFIDGTDTQYATPATITGLPSGTHTYSLVLSGYKTATGTIKIEAGKTTKTSVTLAQEGISAGSVVLVLAGTAAAVAIAVAATRNKGGK